MKKLILVYLAISGIIPFTLLPEGDKHKTREVSRNATHIKTLYLTIGKLSPY